MTRTGPSGHVPFLNRAAVAMMRIANIVATLWILLLMLLIVADILGRDLSGSRCSA